MSTKDAYPPHQLSHTVRDLEKWIQLGLGDEEYYCDEKEATFKISDPPKKMPDLSKHNNIMAEVLKENAGLYEKYLGEKTKSGVTFAHCIKTGMDNKGHINIKTCGIVAGDEESYDKFRELFDGILKKRHNYTGHLKEGQVQQVQGGQGQQLRTDTISKSDAEKYILTSRVRSGRSVRGFQLPPCITFEERRKLEDVTVKALMAIEDEDLRGAYYPLYGSRSHALVKNRSSDQNVENKAECGGMSKQKEEDLRSVGKLFQEPDSTLLLSSGCGRHWPDARGIFQNDKDNALVWVNEEDHMRIIAMEKGSDIQGVFNRFQKLTQAIERELNKLGKEIMYNDRLQYILTCPSNTGTGLRAGCMMKLPELLKRGLDDFKTKVGKMQLQARGKGGVDSKIDGIVDISNAGRIGKSEVEFVNILIDGVIKLIELEKECEAGKEPSW